MIEEQFVSFYTAKLLKEAGFNETCRYSYDNVGGFRWFKIGGSTPKGWVPCPTQALAARWLREAHGIHVCIDVNASGWYYDLCKSDNGTHILWSSYQGPNDGGEWDSYEEALEAGLKIWLELIKKQGL